MTGRRLPDQFHEFVLRVERGSDETIPSMRMVGLRLHAIDQVGTERRANSRIELTGAFTYWQEFGRPSSAASHEAQRLRDAIMPADILRLFYEAIAHAEREQAGLRLRLCISDPELADVPWELASLQERNNGPGDTPVFLALHPGLSVVRQHSRPASANAAHPREASGTVVLATGLTVAGAYVDGSGKSREVPALPAGSDGEIRRPARMLSDGPFEIEWPAEPLTAETLRNALDQPAWGFYFAGHGVRDGILLAGPGGAGDPRLLPAEELAQLLVQAEVAVAILASCDSAAPGHAIPGAGDLPADEPGDHNLAETLVHAGVPYVVGMRAPVSDAIAQDLTVALFRGLAEYRSVDQALAEARSAVPHGWWLPVLHTCPDPVDVRISARELTVEPLRAFHIPPDWKHGDPRLAPGDGFPAQLDVLWGLDRGPLRGVLADPPGTHLAAELWSVETGPLQATPGSVVDREGHFLRRRWFTIPDTRSAAPRTAASLGRLVERPAGLERNLREWPRGASVGLVIRYDAGHDTVARVTSFVAEITRSWPEAAVVVQVTAADKADAVAGAADIGQRLPTDRADRSSLGVTILTRVLPGVGPVLRPPRGTEERPGTALEQVSALVAELDKEPSDNLASQADEQALEQVRRLEKDGSANWQREIRLLLRIRDKVKDPWFYPALLRQHARYRGVPARYASLAAAASLDQNLDMWLSAAASVSRPPEPSALPAGLLSQDAKDAVILALLRQQKDADDAWPPAGRWHGMASPAVRTVMDYLAAVRRDNQDPEQRRLSDRAFLLAETDPAAAAVAVRAGIGAHLTIRELCAGSGPSMAAWAMLARRPLDDDTADLISAWPVSLRRILGFAATRAEPDAEVADRLAVLHGALRPRFPPAPPW